MHMFMMSYHYASLFFPIISTSGKNGTIIQCPVWTDSFFVFRVFSGISWLKYDNNYETVLKKRSKQVLSVP